MAKAKRPPTKTPASIGADGEQGKAPGLSRERIVDAAIELLDADGENNLTFRALATRLATGSGAIYWHIANKNELIAAASDTVIARAMQNVGTKTKGRGKPREILRSIALGVFEALDAHPWIGAQIALAPTQIAMLQIYERVGRQIEVLGVPKRAQFTAAMVLVSYILGESHQNAENGRRAKALRERWRDDPNPHRADYLETVSAQWERLDAEEYRFTRSVANRLREHDDRAEYLAGIDLILAGITALI